MPVSTPSHAGTHTRHKMCLTHTHVSEDEITITTRIGRQNHDIHDIHELSGGMPKAHINQRMRRDKTGLIFHATPCFAGSRLVKSLLSNSTISKAPSKHPVRPVQMSILPESCYRLP